MNRKKMNEAMEVELIGGGVEVDGWILGSFTESQQQHFDILGGGGGGELPCARWHHIGVEEAMKT